MKGGMFSTRKIGASINENKKNMCKIINKDIYGFKPWGDVAPKNWQFLIDCDAIDDLDVFLEDCYPDGIEDVQLNDLLWFDFDNLKSMLGLIKKYNIVFEYSKNDELIEEEIIKEDINAEEIDDEDLKEVLYNYLQENKQDEIFDILMDFDFNITSNNISNYTDAEVYIIYQKNYTTGEIIKHVYSVNFEEVE
jgi:hypothetical protein